MDGRACVEYISQVGSLYNITKTSGDLPDRFWDLTLEAWDVNIWAWYNDSMILFNRAASPSPNGKMGMCFKNSLDFLDFNNFVYVEGYSKTETLPIPIVHAWCVERESLNLVDPTWVVTEGSEYLGLPFKEKFVREMLLMTETWGILDNLFMVADKIRKMPMRDILDQEIYNKTVALDIR